MITPETLQAYHETEYCVLARPPFSLYVGEFCEALKSLYEVKSIKQCAYLTAFNPYSETMTDECNEERQSHLISKIKDEGFKYIQGIGRHPSNGWPPEKSCLILGISLKAAVKLGKEYKQNAIIWCDHDAIPQLIETLS